MPFSEELRKRIADVFRKPKMVDEGEEGLGRAQTLYLKVQRPSQEEKNRSKIPTMPRVKLTLAGVVF